MKKVLFSIVAAAIFSLSSPFASAKSGANTYYLEAAPLKVIWGTAALRVTHLTKNSLGYIADFERSTSISNLGGFEDQRLKLSAGINYQPGVLPYFLSMSMGLKKETIGHRKEGKFFGDFSFNSDEANDKWTSESIYLIMTPAVTFRKNFEGGITSAIDISMDANIYQSTQETILQKNSREKLKDEENMTGLNPRPQIKLFFGVTL